MRCTHTTGANYAVARVGGSWTRLEHLPLPPFCLGGCSGCARVQRLTRCLLLRDAPALRLRGRLAPQREPKRIEQ